MTEGITKTGKEGWGRREGVVERRKGIGREGEREGGTESGKEEVRRVLQIVGGMGGGRECISKGGGRVEGRK